MNKGSQFCKFISKSTNVMFIGKSSVGYISTMSQEFKKNSK